MGYLRKAAEIQVNGIEFKDKKLSEKNREKEILKAMKELAEYRNLSRYEIAYNRYLKKKPKIKFDINNMNFEQRKLLDDSTKYIEELICICQNILI